MQSVPLFSDSKLALFRAVAANVCVCVREVQRALRMHRELYACALFNFPLSMLHLRSLESCSLSAHTPASSPRSLALIERLRAALTAARLHISRFCTRCCLSPHATIAACDAVASFAACRLRAFWFGATWKLELFVDGFSMAESIHGARGGFL
jgi:hypothetical protein